SGQLADKYDRARLMQWVKILEVGIMLTGLLGFWLYSAPLLYVVTFLMGLHSTLFGPAKYAYLPQKLDESELVGGNAMVQMATFVAVLLGTIVGGELARVSAEGAARWIGAFCLVVACIGVVRAGLIPSSPGAQPELHVNWKPITETWR